MQCSIALFKIAHARLPRIPAGRADAVPERLPELLPPSSLFLAPRGLVVTNRVHVPNPSLVYRDILCSPERGLQPVLGDHRGSRHGEKLNLNPLHVLLLTNLVLEGAPDRQDKFRFLKIYMY